MKTTPFNYTLLAVGVVAAMGISSGAIAGTTSGATSNGAAPINNVATASYSVAGVGQPGVTSNIVTVNVSETAKFTLFAISGDSATDDKNENIATTQGATATFNHILINEGNVTDTYNINTTANNDAAIDTATPNVTGYTLPANVSVAYVIRQKGGAALTTDQANALQALGQAQTGNLTGGSNATTRNIQLLPGLEAALSYTYITPITRLGGDIAVGTLTATSAFIAGATTTPKVPTLVNENQTIVRLPTYSIVKTAANNVDLSPANTSPQIAYTIVVTNTTTDYSAEATEFVIRDVLPAGLTLANGATSVTTENGGTVTTSTANSRTTIDVAVASLAIGASRTITFTVNVDKATYTGTSTSATNNVEVYDKFVGPVGVLPANPTAASYDILDSTNNTLDATRVPAAADQPGGAGVDTAATTTFTRRAVVLSGATIREIAPASGVAGQVTQSTVITNSGVLSEGTDTNPLSFTIADAGLNGAVRPVVGPVSVTYTPPGGTPVNTTLQPTVTGGNIYVINSTTLPSGIAPNGTLAIKYNVSSGNVTIPETVADAATIGSTENTIVTLTPAGTGAPAATTVTDTTNVRGLTLVKSQSLDTTCAALATDATYTINSIDATPDQCIIYRINATNTSSTASGFNITGLTISDLLSNFSAGADLVKGSPATSATTSSTAGTASTSDIAVLGSDFTLIPQGVGTLTFKIKIKNAR